jgi:hypothetical protein
MVHKLGAALEGDSSTSSNFETAYDFHVYYELLEGYQIVVGFEAFEELEK